MSPDGNSSPASGDQIPPPGPVFAEHIDELLVLEIDRMKYLGQRGDTIVKTELALATAVVAIVTWVTKAAPEHLWVGTWCVIACAAVALAISLFYGINAQAKTSEYSLTGVETLGLMTGEKWKSDPDPLYIVANRKRQSIEALRDANKIRARHVEVARKVEIAFIGFLLLAIIVEVVARAV